MPDLNDGVRWIEKAMPGAKVRNTNWVKDPAAEAAYQRGTAKWADEVKRTKDEILGGQKVSERDRYVSAKKLRDYGTSLVHTRPARGLKGNPLKLALFRITNDPSEECVRWEDPQDGMDRRSVMGGFLNQYRMEFVRWVSEKWCSKNGVSIPDHPVEKYVPEELVQTRFHYRGRLKRRRNAMSIVDHSGDVRNEHLGGQMVQHAAPEVMQAMEQRGDIQVRKDQNGNDCVYLVSKSRKHQAQQLKEYNRRQADAESRGWKGTRSRHGLGVKYLRHGGLTPD